MEESMAKERPEHDPAARLMDRDKVQSIYRAAAILGALRQAGRPLTVTDVSQALGLHRTTTHRMMMSLVDVGFIHHDPERGLYRLGLGLVELGTAVLQQIDLVSVARPYVLDLSNRTNETTFLAVLHDRSAVYVEKAESPRSVRTSVTVGQRHPLHATSVGKAILAFLPPDQRDRILMGYTLTQYTEKTITLLPDLLTELDRTRERGFALQLEERDPDVNGLAAPVFTADGLVGALCISGPSNRMTPDVLAEFAGWITSAAAVISRKCGYLP